jgi:2-methylisocitrate lyase-like PEP mutase family enzyme
MATPSQAERGRDFLELHSRPGAFALPNVWSPGTAKVVAAAGFEAVATTSAGIAFSLGMPDGQVGRAAMLAEVAAIAEAVDIPVTADVESGYGPEPEDVAETVAGVIAAGAVGANLEDAESGSLFEIERATERVEAAREAADRTGMPFTLNARTDSYLTGHPDPFRDAVTRAARYSEAGADCIFVPGVSDPSAIKRLVDAVDRPLNVVVGLTGEPLDLATYERLGVRRVSTGGSLARAALGFVRQAAEEMRDGGRFDFTAGAIAHEEIMRAFGRSR